MKKRIAKLTFLLMILTVFSVMIAFGENEQVKPGDDGVTRIYDAQDKLITNKPVYEVKAGKKSQYYGIDKDGVATLYKGVEEMAAKQLCQLKAGGKMSIANLKKAFKWAANLPYKNNTKKLKGKAAAEFYGQYGFEYGCGDCNTRAYTFYWMAKILGYPVKAIQGYAMTRQGLQSHAWTTIKFGKTNYFFDPDFNHDHAGKVEMTGSGKKIKQKKYCGFKQKYNVPGSGTYVYYNSNKKKITK